MYSSAYLRQSHSVFITCCQASIYGIFISDIRCQLFPHIWHEFISMLLFKLWFTLNTYNSNVGKNHGILSFSISPTTRLLAREVVIWPPSFVLPHISHIVPYNTTAGKLYAVKLQESMLLHRKYFNLLCDLYSSNYYKQKWMKLKD